MLWEVENGGHYGGHFQHSPPQKIGKSESEQSETQEVSVNSNGYKKLIDLVNSFLLHKTFATACLWSKDRIFPKCHWALGTPNSFTRTTSFTFGTEGKDPRIALCDIVCRSLSEVKYEEWKTHQKFSTTPFKCSHNSLTRLPV